jgi:hypothetical protein
MAGHKSQVSHFPLINEQTELGFGGRGKVYLSERIIDRGQQYLPRYITLFNFSIAIDIFPIRKADL